MSGFIYLVEQFPLYVIVLIRTAGLLGFAPIFNHRSMPMRLRAALAGILAFVILPTIPQEVLGAVVLPDTILGWTFLVVREMLVGALLGFIASMIVIGVMSAGELMARNMGLATAAEFNPDMQMPITPVTKLFMVIFSLAILSLNVHYWFIEALVRSYKLVPINQLSLGAGVEAKLVELMDWIFVIGLRIAAPVLAIMFLISAAMGVMAKAAPQVNILMISFPIRIAIGLLVIGLSIHVVAGDLEDVLIRMGKELEILLHLMA